MTTTPDGAAARADVELRLPADGAYASVLRTTTAGLAARLDFTIEEIEDLRIAASEASALVLPEADAHSDLVCEFFLRPGTLTLALSVAAAEATPLDEDGFAWQVLSTLASRVTTDASGGRFRVTLTMVSELSTPGSPAAAGA